MCNAKTVWLIYLFIKFSQQPRFHLLCRSPAECKSISLNWRRREFQFRDELRTCACTTKRSVSVSLEIGRPPIVFLSSLFVFLSQTSNKRQHHLNKHLYRPSTFLTSYEPPVYMEDEDERSSFVCGLQDGAANDSVSRFKRHATTNIV